MPAITNALWMNGVRVTTPKQFCDRFSPADFLRNREMAAGFARLQLSSLTPWHCFHGELLYQAVFCWEDYHLRRLSVQDAEAVYASDFRTEAGESLVCGPEYYLEIPGIWITVKSQYLSRELSALKAVAADSCPRILSELWALAQETALPRMDRERLFMILSAGYFLAGKTPAGLPITPEAAQAAYLRQPAGEDAGPVETEDEVLFPARELPYVLTPTDRRSTSSILTITVKKLMAVRSATGATKKPAVLKLDGQTVSILPGEYRYASFVDGRIVRIFPLQKENGPVRMERRGQVIRITRNGALVEELDCRGRSIVDFAADPEGHYILLEPGRVDYSHFPSPLFLPTEHIVEVDIQGYDVITLNHKGRVTRNGQPLPSGFPTTLDNLS